MQELMLLMQKQRYSQIANLLLRVFIRTDQIDGLQMPKVHVPSQYIDIQQLANVFLLVVSIEVSILELLPYVC